MRTRAGVVVAALFGLLVFAQGCGPAGGALDAGASDARVDAGDARDAGDASELGVDEEEGSAGIEITPATATTAAGFTATFTATARLSGGRRRDVTHQVLWSSSDPSVATIDATGVATGQRPGMTMITASFEGWSSGPARLTVACEGPRSIQLSPNDLVLTAGDPEPHPIEARAAACDGPTQVINGEMSIMWSSNNSSVATVDALGQVFAGSQAGNAIITARLGSFVGSATVQVAAAR